MQFIVATSILHVIARSRPKGGDVAILYGDAASIVVKNVVWFREKEQATSKNYFLVIWAEDFGSEKVLKTAEYFVYCGVFKTHLWGERFAQSPKGEFLEVPNRFLLTKAPGNLKGIATALRASQ